jgi:broad specificity phosphatase PhoE
MKTLYFIRHGTSQHNVLFKNFGSKIFYDTRYYDTKLTGEGHEQSLFLGKTWDEKDRIELVITSSLSRTLETTMNIFKNTRVPIISLDLFKEFPQGLHTCNKRSTKNELLKKFPRIDFSNLETNEDVMWNPIKEETMDELNERIKQMKEFIQQRHEKKIAIVCHNSIMGQFMNGHIPWIENGDEELKYCVPYKFHL